MRIGVTQVTSTSVICRHSEPMHRGDMEQDAPEPDQVFGNQDDARSWDSAMLLEIVLITALVLIAAHEGISAIFTAVMQ
ncbi:hypothetical protein DM806_04980 [Sphingobium lactosutens]|nr:hypothetical protein [Sphingobium lactosutens]